MSDLFDPVTGLYRIFPPDDYYPRRINPHTAKNQMVLGYIKANFKRYELWPYAKFEQIMVDTYNPFLLKRCLSVLWAHGILEKWVEGDGFATGRNKPTNRRIEVELRERTTKVGDYYGVHYKWI